MKKFEQKLVLGCLLACSLGVAMAQNTSPGGWRRFDPSGPAAADPGAPPTAADPGAPPAADPGAPPAAAEPGAPPAEPQAQFAPQTPPPPQFPSSVTLPAGTWVTIRVNEPISSDHSQSGDAFTGTLAEPIIANGLVIARRGQLVTGVVTEAKKAGRVEGTSRLKLELTAVGLVDGRQVQLKTHLMERRGPTSVGRDAAAIGATTATGAAIGAAVNGGVGAGVGAAAGVVASTIGVLLTRGRPTVVYPETPLTFATETPLTVENSQAFQPASQQDYNAGMARPPAYRPGYGPAAAYGPAYGPTPAPYYGGYYAPYPYPYAYGYPYPYPYYWGPGLYFGFGRGFRRW